MLWQAIKVMFMQVCDRNETQMRIIKIIYTKIKCIKCLKIKYISSCRCDMKDFSHIHIQFTFHEIETDKNKSHKHKKIKSTKIWCWYFMAFYVNVIYIFILLPHYYCSVTVCKKKGISHIISSQHKIFGCKMICIKRIRTLDRCSILCLEIIKK